MILENQGEKLTLNWKLGTAVGMLCKIRHYVNFDTLKMVYYRIFASILNYGSFIWGKHSRIVNWLQTIQNKAIQNMIFIPKRTMATLFCKEAGIVKLSDYVITIPLIWLNNCITYQKPESIELLFWGEFPSLLDILL